MRSLVGVHLGSWSCLLCLVLQLSQASLSAAQSAGLSSYRFELGGAVYMIADFAHSKCHRLMLENTKVDPGACCRLPEQRRLRHTWTTNVTQHLPVLAVPARQNKLPQLEPAQQASFAENYGLLPTSMHTLARTTQPGAGHAPLDSTALLAATSLTTRTLCLRQWSNTFAGTNLSPHTQCQVRT